MDQTGHRSYRSRVLRTMTTPRATAATPFTRETRLAHLPVLLRERILVLDGAMGTLLQRHAFSEADFRGAALRGSRPRRPRRQRPPVPHPARRRARGPSRLPRRGRRHREHQLLHRDPDRAGRLQPRAPRARDQRGGRPTGPRGRRRSGGPRRPPTVRRRLPGPHQPHGLPQPGRQRSCRAQRVLRGARGRVPRGRRRSGRGRRGPPARRDRLRHPQRQGRHLRDRRAVRGPGPRASRW